MTSSAAETADEHHRHHRCGVEKVSVERDECEAGTCASNSTQSAHAVTQHKYRVNQKSETTDS